MNLIRALITMALLVAVAAAAGPDSKQPDLALKDINGQSHSASEYHGKVVIVNFWATWCVPCKHEMPLFVEAAKRYGDRIQVLAVSLDDEHSRANIPAFAQKEKMSFPILLGDEQSQKQLELGEAVPATAFLDKDGHVVAKILGEVSKSELKSRIEWMLGMKGGDAPPAVVNNLNKKKDDDITPIR